MWITVLKNGNRFSQEESNGVAFGDIKDDVVRLGYEYHGTTVWLPEGLSNYRFGGSASYSFGSGSSVDSYWIQGEDQKSSLKIRIRFHIRERKIDIENY